MCLHKLQPKNKITFISEGLGLQAICKLFTIQIQIKDNTRDNQTRKIGRTEAFCSILEAARTATVPKMIRVAFGSHGREKAVLLAIRVIFDIVPHFKTQVGMESEMVQNSRSKIVFTFNKFFIKVKRDFNQAHQNQVTFNGFSFKVTAYFNQAQQQKLTHSTNFNSTPREYCVKLKI